MKAMVFSVVVAFVLAHQAALLSAAQNWKGAQVMPKSDAVLVQSDTSAPVTLRDLQWPATVRETNGRYLRIHDDGGYGRNLAGGWIYADDVVGLDEARDHYSNELRQGETPWLHWMRGIVCENTDDLGVAMLDYKAAAALDRGTQFDDIHIRLGRLLAQQQLQGGRGLYNQTSRRVWEDQFKLAQRINPNRPQLYYEWGLALSHACNCTQNRGLAQLEPAKPKPAPQVVSRGIETGDETTELPGPANQSERKPADNTTVDATGEKLATEKLAGGNSETRTADADKTGAKLGATTQTNDSATPVAAFGPTPAGSEAAIQALANYENAERLNPRWWRIPLARAELMLNQCDQESSQGERVAIRNIKPEFLSQILSHCRKSEVRNIEMVPPPEAIVARGDSDAPNSAGASGAIAAAELPQHMHDVLTVALDDFNKAISLNPSAIDAYRDRGEVLRLLHRFDEAKQSATVACKLCYYRQVGSLRTLAQINHDLQQYEPAADYALRAAELASRDDQQRYLKLWYKCAKLSSGDTAKIAVASVRAGYVASRGDAGEAAGAENGDSPDHIEPPPGFMQRGSTAVPD